MQGSLPEALEWYQKSYAIRWRVLGVDHPRTKDTKSSIDYIALALS